MSQNNKPQSMSPSESRLWCCCHPKVSPPPSSPAQRDNISLEEFDPRNRLSMSRAYGPQLPSPPPPSTPTRVRSLEPKVPVVVARLPDQTPPSVQREGGRREGEGRANQRPTTVLLPSPPHRPSRSEGSQATTVTNAEHDAEHSAPQFIRQDSEMGNHWWQVGRRMLERTHKDRSPRREDRERK
jgi:hypothetical protein